MVCFKLYFFFNVYHSKFNCFLCFVYIEVIQRGYDFLRECWEDKYDEYIVVVNHFMNKTGIFNDGPFAVQFDGKTEPHKILKMDCVSPWEAVLQSYVVFVFVLLTIVCVLYIYIMLVLASSWSYGIITAVKSKPMRAVGNFFVDALTCSCHNGKIETFWRGGKSQSSHFRQHLGPKTKMRLSVYQWNAKTLKKFGYQI